MHRRRSSSLPGSAHDPASPEPEAHDHHPTRAGDDGDHRGRRRAPPPQPRRAPGADPGGPATVDRWPQAVALSMTIILAALVGFAVLYLFGLSGLAEARHQNTLYKTFSLPRSGRRWRRSDPQRRARPSRCSSIPDRLHLSNVVVVEGTTSRDLDGRAGTPARRPRCPARAATSVIYLGKRTTFGGPFSGLLSKLCIGDPITVTTGQGVARYTVSPPSGPSAPSPRRRTSTEPAGARRPPNGYVHPTRLRHRQRRSAGRRPQQSPGGLSAMPDRHGPDGRGRRREPASRCCCGRRRCSPWP